LASKSQASTETSSNVSTPFHEISKNLVQSMTQPRCVGLNEICQDKSWEMYTRLGVCELLYLMMTTTLQKSRLSSSQVCKMFPVCWSV